MPYKPRIIDTILKVKLKTTGAVLVEGPKWCGKTTSAAEIAKSELRLGDPDILNRAKILMLDGVNVLLDGGKPRLLDEWQNISALWDAVRSYVDREKKLGQFIFTGSAVPPNMKDIRHSGTGRFSWVKMRPMSLFESGDSNGAVSLADLFENKKIHGENPLTMKDLAYVTCRGGFPSFLIVKNKTDALRIPYNYLDAVIHSDLSRLDGVNRSPDYIRRLLRSYARFQGEQVSLTEIRKDMEGVTGDTPNINTVSSYHDALKNIFVIEDVPAWNPNLRSRTAIRVSDTRYFVDPALVVAALGVSPEGLFEDLRTFGFVFEALCMRDLRVYADSLGASVSRYRDSNGLECDAVIHFADGKYGLIQMKLGGTEEEIEDAAVKMKNLANLVDTRYGDQLAFMMVLVGAEKYAYQREDGVYVVPVGCFKP